MGNNAHLMLTKKCHKLNRNDNFSTGASNIKRIFAKSIFASWIFVGVPETTSKCPTQSSANSTIGPYLNPKRVNPNSYQAHVRIPLKTGLRHTRLKTRQKLRQFAAACWNTTKASQTIRCLPRQIDIAVRGAVATRLLAEIPCPKASR